LGSKAGMLSGINGITAGGQRERRDENGLVGKAAYRSDDVRAGLKVFDNRTRVRRMYLREQRETDKIIPTILRSFTVEFGVVRIGALVDKHFGCQPFLNVVKLLL